MEEILNVSHSINGPTAIPIRANTLHGNDIVSCVIEPLGIHVSASSSHIHLRDTATITVYQMLKHPELEWLKKRKCKLYISSDTGGTMPTITIGSHKGLQLLQYKFVKKTSSGSPDQERYHAEFLGVRQIVGEVQKKDNGGVWREEYDPTPRIVWYEYHISGGGSLLKLDRI